MSEIITPEVAALIDKLDHHATRWQINKRKDRNYSIWVNGNYITRKPDLADALRLTIREVSMFLDIPAALTQPPGGRGESK